MGINGGAVKDKEEHVKEDREEGDSVDELLLHNTELQLLLTVLLLLTTAAGIFFGLGTKAGAAEDNCAIEEYLEEDCDLRHAASV